MRKFEFWKKWLLVVSFVITIFGLVMAFSNFTFFFELNKNQYNPVFWGNIKISSEITKFQIWNFGVLGAVITGRGTFFIFIAKNPFSNKEKWAWNAFFIGTTIWFIIDTSYSVFFLVYPNVALNSVLFISILLPLLFTKKRIYLEINNPKFKNSSKMV